MIKIKFISLALFLSLSSHSYAAQHVAQKEITPIVKAIKTNQIDQASKLLQSLSIKDHTSQLLALSKDIKIPKPLTYFIWAAAYHAYVVDDVADRQQVAFLLGEAGAEVSSETQQGLLFKEYMLEHFYVREQKN